MAKQKRKPYKIIGAYDSETSTVNDGNGVKSFPILHQLGLLSCPIESITPESVMDVCNVELYRHCIDIYARLDELAEQVREYVPVIVCHNLAFDMWGLSQWLCSHDVRVLAKSAAKPITFTILDDSGNPRLVLWDTAVFTQKSLETMGFECGFPKAVGAWDYEKVRTPETTLTSDELTYATHDVYALLAYLGWWLGKNPDIEPERLGLNVVTKTGVVRERRRKRFDHLRGAGCKYNVGRFWLYQNRREQPKSNEELFSMHACTRGGFTFCASENASVPFVTEGTPYVIAGYDATSQHPAQMVSHVYPQGFHETSAKALDLAFRNITETTLAEVLDNWKKPFHTAFNALFEFDNLRPKEGSIFARDGVLPLASARLSSTFQEVIEDENGDNAQFQLERKRAGYHDSAEGARVLFGKIVSAKKCRLWITELTAWEIAQCYEWDEVRAVEGYIAGRFTKPTDMSVISVMQFYRAKNAFKHAIGVYERSNTIDNAQELVTLGIPAATVAAMERGELDETDVKLQYLSLKADLNALFGIEASNEYRKDTVLTHAGIAYQGTDGIENAPKNPKTWYQFGQRIVGWSRVAQIVNMLLAAPHVETIVNGDTDSIKFLVKRDEMPRLQESLDRYADALTIAKRAVCKRVKGAYPRQFDPLDGIGAYVFEFATDYFYAAWNKAYCIKDKRGYHFTLAGIPANAKERGAVGCNLNHFAERLERQGWTFGEICNLILGYNVTISHSLTGLLARYAPEWGDTAVANVNGERIAECAAMSLVDLSKLLNSTDVSENFGNYLQARENNPDVTAKPVVLFAQAGTGEPGIFGLSN